MKTSPRVLAAAFILAAGSLAPAQEAPVRYDGHRAVRVTVRTARELMVVRSLADDILTCSGSGLGSFGARFSPERYAALVASGIRHVVTVPDIQRSLDQFWADDARIRAEQQHQDDPAWFVTYRSLAEIQTRLQALATAFPNLATLSSVGTSIENRQIQMIRITGPGSTATRPAFVIQANQHAREWVTPMSAMYIADRLLETYATDPRIRSVVDHIDFYIIPCTNPDGYEYSRTTDPFWRKNRRDLPASPCFGVDLNRNWGYQWGYDNSGSSPNPCDETYRGPAAWSEPEIAGPRALIDSLESQQRLAVFWDIHSNAQLILSAWGYTTQPPPDLPLMNTLGAIIQAGMQSVNGRFYPYGPSSTLLYLVNGGARDYAYGAHGAMAWTIEMGGESFMPPVSLILPLAREALGGLLPLAERYLPACYANCDGTTTAPVLNVNDFVCFQSAFAAANPYADCDRNSVLNVNDFICFQAAFAAGCSGL